MASPVNEVNETSVFGALENAVRLGQETRVCINNNAIDSFSVVKSDVPGTPITKVVAGTYSAPDGYVAGETCYVLNLGIGFAGLCSGFSEGSYLGSNNGYPKTSEFQYRFFSDAAFMTSLRCIL